MVGGVIIALQEVTCRSDLHCRLGRRQNRWTFSLRGYPNGSLIGPSLILPYHLSLNCFTPTMPTIYKSRKRDRLPGREYDRRAVDDEDNTPLRLKRKPRCHVLNCSEQRSANYLVLYDCERCANWTCSSHVVEVEEGSFHFFLCQACNDEELGRKTKGNVYMTK